MAFEIGIPEVATERTLDEIIMHLARTKELISSFPQHKKIVNEAIDMVIAYTNKELSYSDALQNIYEIGEGLGMKGVYLGAIVVDMNEIRELIE